MVEVESGGCRTEVVPEEKLEAWLRKSSGLPEVVGGTESATEKEPELIATAGRYLKTEAWV